MSRIKGAFRRCGDRGEGALICYLTAGYPDDSSFLEYFDACLAGGADIMEVGVPFSDPVADGPTIQLTSQVALERGMTPLGALESVRGLRTSTEVPMVLMGYYNPIFRIGEPQYASRASEAGADGLIVADLPLEESAGLRSACLDEGLDLIQLASPLSQGKRMQDICRASQGYLYLVSALGITGTRNSLAEGLPQLIERTVRAAGELPVAVGFGISSPRHVGQVIQAGATGAIVGSALLAQIIEGARPESIAEFVGQLKAATKVR